MRSTGIRSGLLWTAVLFLGMSSGAAQQRDGKPVSDLNTAAKIEKPINTESRSAASTESDYRIGVNDVIDVHVWKEPELSRVVPVRPDGKISLPLIGELRAHGRTASELHDLIATRLKAYLLQPAVTVIIQQINSQRYFVMGEVQRPGPYPLNLPTTLIEALAMAGGFREWARTDRISIIRPTDKNKTERIYFNYKDWAKKKQQAELLELKNGDIIVVP